MREALFDFSTYLIPFITAIDFRAKLRFPRAVGEPPQLRLRGLT
jgi:hypothetical protein